MSAGIRGLRNDDRDYRDNSVSLCKKTADAPAIHLARLGLSALGNFRPRHLLTACHTYRRTYTTSSTWRSDSVLGLSASWLSRRPRRSFRRYRLVGCIRSYRRNDGAPRSSLITSDEPLSSETSNGTRFVVLMSGEPQGGIKARRSDAAKTIAGGRRLTIYDTQP
jgi:hypothetical protein